MSDIISLKDHKRKKEIEHATVKCEADSDAATSFEEIAKLNKQKEEKLKAERLANNKNVLKSYRIT